MWKYIIQHETFVKNALLQDKSNTEWEVLRIFHEKQIAFMQHERLIHLLVTLFVAMFLLLSVGFLSLHPNHTSFAIAGLFLVLVVPYVIHYFRLENGVQRWYELSNAIDNKCGHPKGTSQDNHN